MSTALKIVAALIVLAVALMGGAIVKNKVPLAEPPGLFKRLKIYLTSNSARTRAGHELPELRSRTYPLPADRLLPLAAQAVEDAGWRIEGKNAGRHRLHAVATTEWLGFKDDLRIALEAAPHGSTLVTIQSRSRIGRADFGANIAHIVALHRRLDALVEEEIAGPHPQ